MWGDDRCTELEAAVERIMDRATHVPRGTAEPSVLVLAVSVISIIMCLSLIVGGLTGLVLILDRFLPAEAVFDGLSVVGHSALHCINGLWRFFTRRPRAQEPIVEPMVVMADGDRRPMAVVVPEQVQVPEAEVQPNLYPALFQVILLVYSCVILGKRPDHI